MKELNRKLAPLSPRAWERVDREAREVLELQLAARRLVDFDGPHGWEHSAMDLVRVEPVKRPPAPAVQMQRRVVRPLVELRVPFALERRELERLDRGAGRVDLDPLRDAAREFAAAEDATLFEGSAEADIPGLLNEAESDGVDLPADSADLPDAVSDALAQLRRAGVAGPYAMALGPRSYRELDRASSGGGYPVLKHVESLLDRPVTWAPQLQGGLLLSLRGGDFVLFCGRDAAIGYTQHDEDTVSLYLEESFSAEVNGPEAVVPLRAPGG